MLHCVLASFRSDMLRILLVSYFVSLINCQQDYYGEVPKKPYQAPKTYHKPSQPKQDSPKPYQAAHHVYHQEEPQPYEDSSSYGGLTHTQVVTGDSPRAYGDNYSPPDQGASPRAYGNNYSPPDLGTGAWRGGISHRFQKPSSIKHLTEPRNPFYPQVTWSQAPPVVEARCEPMYDCLAWPFMECMVRLRNTTRRSK